MPNSKAGSEVNACYSYSPFVYLIGKFLPTYVISPLTQVFIEKVAALKKKWTGSMPYSLSALHIAFGVTIALYPSTHDLTRRSTECDISGRGPGHLSTHDLTRRSTASHDQLAQGKDLSTHDLTRRSTLSARRPVRITGFQLTTSQGGRRLTLHQNKDLRVFQLTTSQGGRPILAVSCFILFSFQLTTSQGGRHNTCWIRHQRRILSTHDLTRRSTM